MSSNGALDEMALINYPQNETMHFCEGSVLQNAKVY